jgi:hypothetical protein
MQQLPSVPQCTACNFLSFSYVLQDAPSVFWLPMQVLSDLQCTCIATTFNSSLLWYLCCNSHRSFQLCPHQASSIGAVRDWTAPTNNPQQMGLAREIALPACIATLKCREQKEEVQSMYKCFPALGSTAALGGGGINTLTSSN